MLPNVAPPTDNLYKFMAIGGLLLLVSGLVYPQMRTEALNAKQRGFEKAMDQMSLTIHETFHPAIARIKAILPFPIDEQTVTPQDVAERVNSWKRTAPPEDVARLDRDLKETLGSEFLLALQNFAKSFNELHPLVQEYLQERDAVIWWKRFGYSGATLGGLASLCGFLLWYRRLQMLQDSLLRQQLRDDEGSKWIIKGGEVKRDAAP